MKKFFLLLIVIVGGYCLYSGFTGANIEAMNLSSEITYDIYTNFIPDTDGFWGFRSGKVMHYDKDGKCDHSISVNADEPVIASGDILTVYDGKGGDVLNGYDRHGKELWSYNAGGNIEDVKIKRGDNVFMVYLKDNVHHMAELNERGAKLNDWVASDDYIMDYDFEGDMVYVASANTSKKLGGRITAYDRGGSLKWAQELDGCVPLMVKATDEGISAILDKKLLSLSDNGKKVFEKDMDSDCGCIDDDGNIFVCAGGRLYGQAAGGRSLFKMNLSGAHSVYPAHKGVLVLGDRTVRLFSPGGKVIASYDDMRDIDYLVPLKNKDRALAVGRSGADLITLTQGQGK